MNKCEFCGGEMPKDTNEWFTVDREITGYHHYCSEKCLRGMRANETNAEVLDKFFASLGK